MNDLRLILLLLGAVVIVGLYLWDTLQEHLPGQRRLAKTEGTDPDSEPGVDLRLSAQEPDGEDVAALLSSLRTADAEPGLDHEATTEPVRGGDRIITLHVVADPARPFAGPEVHAALKAAGLEFGEMSIYHHYGLPGMRSEQPLFHLANMVEPGVLKPGTMEGFSTPGLSLFMVMPTPMDAGVVLDLMLVSARTLARRLGGTVMTHERQALSEAYVQQLREQINRHA